MEEQTAITATQQHSATELALEDEKICVGESTKRFFGNEFDKSFG